MSAPIDTLEILIEADRSGLESQLKRAGQTISDFVGSMNTKEISWTQILSKNITPALMASIASTFAIAVTQALQFQTAVQQASLSSASTLNTGSNQMTDAILGVSSATGQSATDVATAYGDIAQSFKNAQVALAVLNGEAQIATIRGMDLVDVSRLLNPALQAWGVDTVDGANKALEILNSETRVGTIGFNDLANAVADAGVSLRDKISLSDTVAQIERLSTVSGETAPVVVSQFKVIAEGLQNPLSPLSILNGGFDHLTSLMKSGGLPAVFQDIANRLKEMGPAAYTLGQQMGFSNDQIKVFMDSAPGAFAAVKPLADADVASVKSLNDQLGNSMTLTKELKIIWTSFINDMIKGLSSWNSALGEFFKMVFDLAKGDIRAALGLDKTNPTNISGMQTTTPALMGIKTPSDNAMNSSTSFQMNPSSNPGGSPINNYNNFNMQINAPAGAEAQVGQNILGNLKDMTFR